MSTTISKTVITVTVLHRTDQPVVDLYEALERIDTGHGVGFAEIGTAQYVEDRQVAEELQALGNDGTFFEDDLADEDGIDDEWDGTLLLTPPEDEDEN